MYQVEEEKIEEFECKKIEFIFDSTEYNFESVLDVCDFIFTVELEIEHCNDYIFNGKHYTGYELIQATKCFGEM